MFYIEPNSPLCRKGREPNICSDPECLCRFSEFKQHVSIKIMDLAELHVDFMLIKCIFKVGNLHTIPSGTS